MSGLFFFSTGVFVGVYYIKNLDQGKYTFFRKSFYEPHEQYRLIKKFKRENDIAYNYQDVEIYIKRTILSALNFFYYHLYGENREFQYYKQQNNFELIKNFEFMNETLKDFDNLTKQIKERISQENGKLEAKMLEKENLQADLRKEIDDKNLENILLLQENTKDEFIKYQLSQNISTRADYEKSILPEIHLLKQTSKAIIAYSHSESKRLWEERRKNENMNDYMAYKAPKTTISDLRNKEYLEKIQNKNEAEIIKYEQNKKNSQPGVPDNFSEFKGLFNIDNK